MAPPTLWQHARQIVGRALRESGQALDRLGVKTASLAVTKHDFYDDPVVYEDHLSRHRHLFPLLTSGRPIIHPEVAYLAPCSTLIGTVVVGRNSSVWYGAVLRGDTCENAESFSKSYYQIASPTTETKAVSESVATTHLSASDSKGGTVPSTTLEPEYAPPTPWPLDPQLIKDQTTHHGGAIFIGDETNLQDGCIVTARRGHTVIGNGVTVGHLAQLHSCTVHDFALIGMGSVLQPGVVVEREAMVAAGAVVLENTIVKSGELWVGAPARKVRDLTALQREKLHYQSSEYVGVAMTQRNVMTLGGNVDPDTGISVTIQSEEPHDEVAFLPDDDTRESIASGEPTSPPPDETLNDSTSANDERAKER